MSEQYVSKYLKAIKDQDMIHEETVQFYQNSEKLLKNYYEQKLEYTVQQFKAREQKLLELQKVQKQKENESINETIKEILTEHHQKQMDTISKF